MNEVLDKHLPKDYSPYTFDAHHQENAPLVNLDYNSMHNAQDFLVNRERMKAETDRQNCQKILRVGFL